jgi:acyl-CoA thioesterase
MTLDHVPFAKLLGIEVDSVEPGHAVLSMKLRDDLMRNNGIAHGGAIATLIDSSMAIAIMALLEENERTVTVDLTIHYLRPLVRVLRAHQREWCVLGEG